MQVKYSSASTKGHAEKARTSTAAFAQFRWTGMIPVLAKGLSGSQGIQRRILRRARVPFSCTPVSGPVVTLSGCMVIHSTIVFVPGVWGFFNAIKAPQIDLSWQAHDLYRRLNGEYDLLMWTPRERGAQGYLCTPELLVSASKLLSTNAVRALPLYAAQERFRASKTRST